MTEQLSQIEKELTSQADESIKPQAHNIQLQEVPLKVIKFEPNDEKDVGDFIINLKGQNKKVFLVTLNDWTHKHKLVNSKINKLK